jgi:hypothetical protein
MKILLCLIGRHRWVHLGPGNFMYCTRCGRNGWLVPKP